MTTRALTRMLLTSFAVFLPTAWTAAQQAQDRLFQLEEATIADVHAAFEAGRLTCGELVQMYLDRIAAYEDGGPRLNLITTVNPNALEVAAALDEAWRRSG